MLHCKVQPESTFPVSSYFIEDLSVGMEARHSKTVSEGDINSFAAVSGDFNPVHMDEDYAASTFFKSRIAHGMLSASFISTVLGTKLPGHGCIYLSQTLRFLAPVRIGDTVTALARVVSLDTAKRRAELSCFCEVGGKVVLEGEATVFVPSRA
jgi:3-hydroxybutyryl-CoA dehydratase